MAFNETSPAQLGGEPEIDKMTPPRYGANPHHQVGPSPSGEYGDGSGLPEISLGQGEAAALAKRLEAEYAKSEAKSAADLEPEPAEWAPESSRIAETFAFSALNNATTLPDPYVDQASTIIDQRMALAGLRIAEVLNVDLDTPHAKPKRAG